MFARCRGEWEGLGALGGFRAHARVGAVTMQKPDR